MKFFFFFCHDFHLKKKKKKDKFLVKSWISRRVSCFVGILSKVGRLNLSFFIVKHLIDDIFIKL